jgi:hypothetical protein
MGFALIAFLVIPVVVLNFFVLRLHKKVKDERRRTLENALKEYARGMTMDEDPFLGQLKTRHRDS